MGQYSVKKIKDRKLFIHFKHSFDLSLHQPFLYSSGALDKSINLPLPRDQHPGAGFLLVNLAKFKNLEHEETVDVMK